MAGGMLVDPNAVTRFFADTLNDVNGYFYLNMVEAFAQGAAEAGARASKQLIEMARVFETGIADNELTAIHQSVARVAQTRVLQSYGNTVSRRGAGSYRSGSGKWQRYAGGKLRDALADPDFFEADAFGISFINVRLLNQRAKQWARLNFGAGDRGQARRPRQFEITWGTQVIAVLGLQEEARPAFYIPKGYWFDGAGAQYPDSSRRGMDAFYVAGSGPMKSHQKPFRRGSDGEPQEGTGIIQPFRPTKGIRARNFFDPGINHIAKEVPDRYKRLYDDLYKQGIAKVRSANVTIKVSSYRPRSF